MKLLIITQKVDRGDSALGFFHAWIEEFAKRFEKVSVVCLEEGAYQLPGNVSIFSLGKERYKIQDTRYKIQKKFSYIFNFYTHVWRLRNEYDIVFVHMNPEYVVFGGPPWRLWNKKIALWYVHRNVNLKLKIAEKFAHIVFSTTPEAFRLESQKVHFVGHGIDPSFFLLKSDFNRDLLKSDFNRFKIIHVGRITPIKNLDILIEAAGILKKEWNKKFKITLIGAPTAPGDKGYEKKLRRLVEKYGLENEVFFAGMVPFARIGELYREADISINLTPTGGMDKAVLESIVSGTLALSANKAFKDLFGKYAGHLLYNERDPEDTALKIMAIGDMELSRRREIEDYVYAKVRNNFSLDALISRIIKELKTV